MRVFAYRAPIDMRKSFNTLSALVLELGHEVVAGDVFVFVGKRRRRAKVLWFDGTGLCLLAKRLEKGRFAPVWERAELMRVPRDRDHRFHGKLIGHSTGS